MQMLLLEGDDMNQKQASAFFFVWFCCWSLASGIRKEV